MVIQFDEEKQKSRIRELKQKESENLAEYLSSRYGIGYVDLGQISIDTNALRIIREENARKASVAAFRLFNKKINLAVLSPNKDGVKNITEDLERQGFSVELFIVSEKSLEYAWGRYKDISFATESSAGTLDIASDSIEEFIEKARSIEDAKEMIEEIKKMKKSFRISRIVEIVIAGAIASKASDIHIEPEENDITLRFRLDGVLVRTSSFDYETYNLLLSRIKLLSGLKLNIKNQAQNGRFSIKIGKTEFEIRTSTLPGNHGESIVMRLLDPNSLRVPLKDLGIPKRLFDKLLREVDRPNGMILNTGPTGSGKTTTLYSFLNRKNNSNIKIITIEDPIEYHLTGIVQTQVDSHKNYDFASGLKNSLRQDPDVIMVGEIRDAETAETAVQASLTGHLVFSTLHTNSAAGAFPRLADLNVDSKIMTSAINVSIAQRLVRKVCRNCAERIEIPKEKIDSIKLIYDDINEPDKPSLDTLVYKAKGCSECNNTGYRGRLGIFEAIFMSKEIEKIIHSMASESEIVEVAKKEEFITMQQDGLLKILNGITTLDEVERVVGFF